MKPIKRLQVTIMFMFVFLSILMLDSLSFGKTIRAIPLPSGAQWIEAINVLDDNPSEIVFTTQNIGAGCGGGTPVTAWKITIDPGTGEILSTSSHGLSLIQNTRQTLYESSSGALFTGGGWCGPKPPYYSMDRGDTWLPANVGTHPPNSTFSFIEYNGAVYAGTGYSPWPGEVYRWLGGGTWEKVFQIPTQVRNIVSVMAEYNEHLFVGSYIYASGAWEGTVPVYVSCDGENFIATCGIPSSQNIRQLLLADDSLLSLTNTHGYIDDYSLYRWNGTEWQYHAPYDFDERIYYGLNQAIAVSEDGILYTTGKAPGDDSAGFYRSCDLGVTWYQFDVLDNYRITPEDLVTAMHLHNDILYVAFTPEPATVLLLGLGGMALLRRRKV